MLNQLFLFSNTLRQANFQKFLGFVKILLLSHQRSCRPFLMRYVLITFSKCFRPVSLPANLQFPAIFLYKKSLQPLLTLIPPYEKVANVIRGMKSSGSSCLLDQISVICFKRFLYLRTAIREIIAVVWKSGRVPSTWKRACTILVHKKGNLDDPANFRPITLQSFPLKIFTSCPRDTIFSFLKQNGFVEQRI